MVACKVCRSVGALKEICGAPEKLIDSFMTHHIVNERVWERQTDVDANVQISAAHCY